MAVRLRLSTTAFDDMDAIVDYLRARNPAAAARFVDAAEATFEHIVQAPRAYPKLASSHRSLRGIRSRSMTGAFGRYRVFYRVERESVDVIRVLHSARDIERLLSEDCD